MVRRKQEYWQWEPEEFSEDQGGTQHWRGLDPFSGPVKADFPVQSLPVLCAARAGEAFGAQPDTPSPTRCRPANRTPAVPSALLNRYRHCIGRRPRLERILSFAAPAFTMPQDAVDDPGIRNKGNNAHAAAAMHNRGSASKIFLIKRAHVLRASLETSGLSCSGSFAAGMPAFWSCRSAAEIRPRLE